MRRPEPTEGGPAEDADPAPMADHPAGEADPASAYAPDGGGPGPRRRSPLLWPLTKWRLNVTLFVLTIVTTRLAGGWAYCATLVGILLCHEMGHYLTARWYRVKASLPYFIPVPFAFGTFGAVIKMDDSIPDRRALVAIGASGPLAGLAVAIPLLFYGLSLSSVTPEVGTMPGLTEAGLVGIARDILDPSARGGALPLFMLEGNSILYWLAKHSVLDIPPGHDVWIHPVAFAAWIGLFVTALNMIPVGQLDGGHVAYGLWGERAHRLNNIVRGVLLGLGLTVWMGWLVWVVLITFMLRATGGRHPPVRHPGRPLGGGMRAMAWASLVTLVITFSPTPLRQIYVTREQALALPQVVKTEMNTCAEQLDWLYDTQRLPFRERLRATVPECP